MVEGSLPDALRFPEIIGNGFLGGMRELNLSRGFIVTTLDGEPVTEIELDNPCKFGFATDEICCLFGRDEIFFSTNQWNSFEKASLCLRPDEAIGALVLYEESFIVSLYRTKTDRVEGLQPRSIRISFDGSELWSSKLPITKVAYVGCQEINAETGGVSREIPAWNPRTWLPYTNQHRPICSDGLTLLSYSEMPRSGIGCHYVVDARSGELVWKGKAGPISETTGISGGKFLLGLQGYGAFETHLYADGDGESTQWPSHGICFVSESGRLMSVQLSNDLSVHQHVVELHENGRVFEHSERLPGYYTSNIVQTGDGTAYFWRADQLWAWSEVDGLSSILKIGLGDGSYGSLHQISDKKIALNIRHGYGERLHERIWAIVELKP